MVYNASKFIIVNYNIHVTLKLVSKVLVKCVVFDLITRVFRSADVTLKIINIIYLMLHAHIRFLST